MSLRKILIIDDEEDIREVATLTLETMAGFEVITASDGISGVSKAEQEQPDVILLDVMMPGVDGMVTFERLRQNDSTREIPVVFMTAKVQAADRKRLSDLGARGIISKPFDPMTLADEVIALVGG